MAIVGKPKGDSLSRRPARSIPPCTCLIHPLQHAAISVLDRLPRTITRHPDRVRVPRRWHPPDRVPDNVVKRWSGLQTEVHAPDNPASDRVWLKPPDSASGASSDSAGKAPRR